MSRVIKFRGISQVTGRWKYGSFCEVIQVLGKNPVSLIVADNYDEYIVKPETVGQFTGKKTKDGTEIYQGDILGGYPHGTAVVEWNEKSGCWMSVSFNSVVNEAGDPSTEREETPLSYDLENCFQEWRVIGNIYSTPELLKQ